MKGKIIIWPGRRRLQAEETKAPDNFNLMQGEKTLPSRRTATPGRSICFQHERPEEQQVRLLVSDGCG
ncbi:MAG: hypothetical protein ACLS6G_08490 [Christensenellales bacterium]